VAEGKRNLRDVLRQVAFSLNTTTNASLGKTPFEMLYGYVAVLPGEPPRVSTTSRPSIRDIRKEAHERLISVPNRLRENDTTPQKTPFAVGDRVMAHVERRQSGLSKKLQPRYVGPWVIQEKVADHTYRVEDSRGRELILNAKDLRPYARTHTL